jgi:hypothetical protein
MHLSIFKTITGFAIFIAFFVVCFPAIINAQTGLFWSVVKPGSMDTSFLLGTLHKYPKTVVQVPPVVEEKLANCRTLYLEMQLDWKMLFKMLTSGTINSEMMMDEDKEWTEEDWLEIEHWFVQVQKMNEEDFNRIKGNASSSLAIAGGCSGGGAELGIFPDGYSIGGDGNIPGFAFITGFYR